MLQFARNISTSRINAFLEFMLKPICAIICKTAQTSLAGITVIALADMLSWKDCQTKSEATGRKNLTFAIVVADMKALHPSLCRETVTKTLDVFRLQHSGVLVAIIGNAPLFTLSADLPNHTCCSKLKMYPLPCSIKNQLVFNFKRTQLSPKDIFSSCDCHSLCCYVLIEDSSEVGFEVPVNEIV